MLFNILAYIVIGFCGGAIAKAILPGKQGGGFVKTTALGIVGSFVGGMLGRLLLDSTPAAVFSVTGLVTSVIGAIVVLVIYGWLQKRP